MLIIVEGPDNSGKSTLVAKVRSTGWRDIVEMLDRSSAERMRSRTHETLRRTDSIVCERFHPTSDAVYRRVYGGERAFSPFEYGKIKESLRGLATRIVYCRPPVTAIADQSTHRATSADDAEWVRKVYEELPKLLAAYDAEMAELEWTWGIPVLRYDWTARGGRSAEIERLICAV